MAGGRGVAEAVRLPCYHSLRDVLRDVLIIIDIRCSICRVSPAR